MKKVTYLLMISILLTIEGRFQDGKAEYYSNAQQFMEPGELNDSILVGIQAKIMQAFVQSKINANTDALINLEEILLKISERSKNPIVEYWLAYTWYYHSIYFLTNQEMKESEKALKYGIEILENVKVKTSEHYALIALMQSFSIQFSTGWNAEVISGNVKKNAYRAIESDSLNLRGYYVMGSNDFYTPEQYGGGKECEKYLIKAISLKEQSIENPYLPSWGRNQAYELLIRYYLKNGKTNLAKTYFKEAIKVYPDDYMLNQLAGKIASN